MRLRSRTALLTAVILLLAMPQVTHAAPQSMERDVTENRYSFEYDESTGTRTQQTSHHRDANGSVRFEVAVAEADGYGSGLVGRLKLRLEGDEAVLYDGWFELTVTNDDGEVGFRNTKPRTVHLKPKPGQRKATLTFRFDLPSGSYKASGTFESN